MSRSGPGGADRIPKPPDGGGRRTAPFFVEKRRAQRGTAKRGMAIFHMHSSYGSRQNGRSARAEAAYLLRLGKAGRGRDDLVDSCWGNLPDWCGDDVFALFEAADRYERANGRLFEELEGALPCELTLEQNIELARTMAHEVTAAGLPHLLVIHNGRPPAPGVPRNRHWHLMFLERINDGIRRDARGWFRRANKTNPAAGGAAKERSLKGHEWSRKVREQYERLVNEALERAGYQERVTAASHRDRIVRAEAAGDIEAAEVLRRHPPGLHRGPAACAIERGRPGRPGRPSQRGERARARDAEAAGVRAELERVEHELAELMAVVEVAARDARVDVAAVVDQARAGQQDVATALLAATDKSRLKILEEARDVGLDADESTRVRREAKPEDPDLGWSALAEQVAEIRESAEAELEEEALAREKEERQREERRQTAEAAARSVFVDIDAVYRRAREQNEDELAALEAETAEAEPVVAAAQAAGLADTAIKRIHEKAESTERGSGWGAVSQATEDRNERWAAAKAAAAERLVEADAVRRDVRDRNGDELAALEQAVAEAEPVVTAARAAGLDDATIGCIRDEAESQAPRSGWRAVTQATTERVRRKSEREAAARRVLIDVDTVVRDARARNEDEVDALEQAVAEAEPMVAAARAAGLRDAAIGRIRRDAESNERGSGWAAVSKATEDRNKRWAAAEAAAAEWLVDANAVRRDTRDQDEDEVDALEQAVAKAEPVVAAARAAGLDDATIGRIRREAELQAPGSGWKAVTEATTARVQRKSEWEAAARRVLIDVDTVLRGASARNEDELAALEQAVAEAEPVVTAARAAGLGDAAIGRIRREAESTESGSGWAAVTQATAERVQRKAQLEAAARRVFVDSDAVYKDARDRNEDEPAALEQAVAKAKPVVAAARSAGLADTAIKRIRDEAESNERGSGWVAVSKATEDRTKRRAAAEVAAGEWLVDIDAVCRRAREQNEDEVDALEQAIAKAKPVVVAARAAGLADTAIKRIRGEAESNERGSGWAAVSEATQERNKRQVAAEAAAGEWLVDIDAVRQDARDGNKDELVALEREITKAKPVVTAARAAGLDDAAIGRIHREAESTKSGSGWAAVTQAGTARVHRRSELESAARSVLVDVDAVYKDAEARNEDGLDALEDETKEADPVVAAARAAGLADTAIKRIRGEAESNERGSGWAAVSEATQERNKRQVAAEAAAGEWLVDIDAVRQDARDGNKDELVALEREITKAKPVVTAARAAGLGDAAIGRIRREAESTESGSGWTAVTQATAERVQRKAQLEAATRLVLVDFDAVYKDARDRNADELDAIEQAVAKAKPVVAAARAAGLADAAVKRIRDEAESTKRGSGWTAVSKATKELLEKQREVAAEEQRKRSVAQQLDEAERRRAARRETLVGRPGGPELYEAWLTAIDPAWRDGGKPSDAQADQALEAAESDGRLARLAGALSDAEQRSCCREVLGAKGQQITLEQIDRALRVTEDFVCRKNAIFEYPGNKDHLGGGGLYGARIKALAPDWRPGMDLPAGLPHQVLEGVESQLADRVQSAADGVEAGVPTTQPWSHQPRYRVPALSDELLDQLVQDGDNAFVTATLTELQRRYARRADLGTPHEERYSAADRRRSQQWHLTRSTPLGTLSSLLREYRLKLREIVLVACDKVIGGDLGARLAHRREQVGQAADAAEEALPMAKRRPGLPSVPAVSDATLEGLAAAGKPDPFFQEVVAEVRARYARRARFEMADEGHYADGERRESEQKYLSEATESRYAREHRLWLTPGSFPRPTREAAGAHVVKSHHAAVLRAFEIGCDKVVGSGQLGIRLRKHRAQVQRAADAVQDTVPTQRSFPARHVPAVSDVTLAELRADADPFLEELVDVVWDRWDRRADQLTPKDRYDHDDRRSSESAYLAEQVGKACAAQQQWSPSSTQRDAAWESALKDHRSRIRGIFTAARDAALRADGLQNGRPAQSVPPERSDTTLPPEGPPGASMRDRRPQGGEEVSERRQDQAERESETDSAVTDQNTRSRAVADPTAERADASVSDADRMRLAAGTVEAMLPRTQLYPGNRSHRPPAVSNKRFSRIAAATDDEYVRSVITQVQRRQTYTDLARAKSEKEHLRAPAARKHAEALARYKTAEAKRGFFSRRSPEPSWDEAEAAAIEEFETALLDKIREVCREIRQLTAADIRRKLKRFAPIDEPPRSLPIRTTKRRGPTRL